MEQALYIELRGQKWWVRRELNPNLPSEDRRSIQLSYAPLCDELLVPRRGIEPRTTDYESVALAN